MSTTGNKLTNNESLQKNMHSFQTKKIALVLCLLIVIPFFVTQIKQTSAATLNVPSQYPTIKAAVGAALTGDTIEVSPGVYYENRIIIESTITGLSIVGANPETTIIDGMGNGTIFDIDGTNVYITGFTLRNAGDHNAIASEKGGPSGSNDYQIITNNIITTSAYGVSLLFSNRDKIVNNTFIDNPLGGISLSTSANTNITGNIIKNSAYGVILYNSATNTIASNQITLASYGVHLSGSSTGVTIKNNILQGRTAGIYAAAGSNTANIDHNTIIDGSAGIYLQNTQATVNYNKITNSSYAIRLYYASATTSSHNIRNNKVTGSDWAIEATYSYGNTFKANWIQDNTWGVWLAFSYSNTFYQNNFINNTVQTAAGTGTNTWYSGTQGNYWSDYKGVDANQDGIGDTPYLISPIGQDNYPLMKTWSEHDISIENVTTDATKETIGTTINITVTVKNIGKLGVAESFTVTAKRNGTTIQTKPVTNLAAGATQNVTFNWSTAGLNEGNYTISAQTSTVTDELNENNNKFNDGTIQFIIPIIGDVNGDGTVNQLDLDLLTQAYSTTSQDPGWNSNTDLNHDGIIDAKDLQLLGKDYGETV